MKKYVLSLAAITILGMSYSLMNNQMDAKSNASGAPGSSSCAVGGCHGGSVLTSDDVSLMVMDGTTPVTSYTPGKTYMVHISADMTNNRFGFALSASSGTLTAGIGSQKATNYLTHTLTGSAADPSGGKMWMAEWTAPTSGPATFQLYLNATNNDGSSNGDKIYGKTLSFFATGLSDIINEKSLSVYPNPINDLLHVDFEIKKSETVSITVFDINGKQVSHLLSEKMESGKKALTFNNDLPQGLYLLNVNAGEQSLTKRIFIN